MSDLVKELESKVEGGSDNQQSDSSSYSNDSSSSNESSGQSSGSGMDGMVDKGLSLIAIVLVWHQYWPINVAVDSELSKEGVPSSFDSEINSEINKEIWTQVLNHMRDNSNPTSGSN